MSLKILFGVTEVLGKRIRKVVAFMYQLASTTAIMILPDSNPRDLENSLAKPEKYDLYAFPRKGLIPLNISILYHGFSDKANEIRFLKYFFSILIILVILFNFCVHITLHTITENVVGTKGLNVLKVLPVCN